MQIYFIKTKNIPYLVGASYFLVAIFILREIIFTPGTIGFFHDWFVGPYPEMTHLYANSGFYLWDSQTGNKLYPTDWIFRVFITPISFLSGEIFSKGLLLFLIILSGISAFSLCRQLKLSPISSFVAGLLYIFSPIMFTRIIAGHLYYLLAYALSPLILANFLKGREEGKKRYFIISGILTSFAIIQLQFIVMLFIVLLIFSLVDFKYIKKSIVGMIIIFILTISINLFPLVLSQISYIHTSGIPFNPQKLLSYHEIVAASDLLKSFRLVGYEIHPYSYTNLSKEGVIPQGMFYLDFLVPILAFSVIFIRKDKYVLSFALISLIGLFLLKGLNPPLPIIFQTLFGYGFYLFRELWHIAFLYGFSLTFLVAFFVEEISSSRFKNNTKIILSVSLASLMIISNGYPLLIGTFGGYLQTYNFPEEYHTVYKEYSLNDSYNILILPSTSPIKFGELKLPGSDPLIRYSQNSIFAQQMVTTYSTMSSSAWLLSLMQENRTDNLGRLLSGFGVKYVILRRDFVSVYPNYVALGSYPYFKEKWNTSLEPFLDSQKDLSIISNTTYYKIYKNTNEANKFFTPITFANGLSDFNALLFVSNNTSLSNVALYQNSHSTEQLTFLDALDEKKMPFESFMGLGRYTTSYNANKGWTTNRDWFGYTYLLASRTQQGAFSSMDNSTLSFELDVSKYENKPVEIWLKTLEWPKGGRVSLNINGEETAYSLSSWNYNITLIKVFEGIHNNSSIHFSVRNINGENYVEGIYIKEKEPETYDAAPDKILTANIKGKETNLVLNQRFASFDNSSTIPSQWYNNWNTCNNTFECAIDSTSGWDDNTSFRISTTLNNDSSWSWIDGGEIMVNAGEEYEIVTHMYLNEWAVASHIPIEGFDETSKKWYQLIQCPAGINGPLEWKGFRCTIPIPKNVSKIRPVLNAGWSSQKNMRSTTLFDDLRIFKLEKKSLEVNYGGTAYIDLEKLISQERNSLVYDYTRRNPTLYTVRVNASAPFMLAFAESYDPLWYARIDKINGTKVKSEMVRPVPLYSVINGFWINQTGDLDITIEYEPQKWFYIGAAISITTLLASIGYLIYDWRKNRKTTEKAPAWKGWKNT